MHIKNLNNKKLDQMVGTSSLTHEEVDMYHKNNHRAPGSGSISQNPSGTWRAQAQIPSSEGNKPVRKTHSFRTKKEAADWLRKLLDDVEIGLSAENVDYKLSEYFSRWLDLKRDQIEETTLEDYSRNGRLYILPYWGDKRIRKIKIYDINSFYIELEKRKVGKRTIGYIHSTLSSMLSYAAREGVISSNPCAYAKPPRSKNTQKPKILSKAELAAFLEITYESRFKVLFLVAVITGMRLGELLGLRWRDVDLVNGYIHVSGQIRSRHLKGKNKQITKTKSEAGNRFLPVGEKLIEQLKQHYEKQQRHKMLMGIKWIENDYVFPSSIGTSLQPGYPQKEAKHNFAMIGLDEAYTFHTLRHTTASFLIHHGMSLVEVSRYLGHSTPATTMKYYAHLVAGGLERARIIQDHQMLGARMIVKKAETDFLSLNQVSSA